MSLFSMLFGKTREEPSAQSQVGGADDEYIYWVDGQVPHGLEGSGFFESDGWEIPAWSINIYRALRGLGWDHDMAHAGMAFAAPLVDEGILDEVTLLRRALRVGD